MKSQMLEKLPPWWLSFHVLYIQVCLSRQAEWLDQWATCKCLVVWTVQKSNLLTSSFAQEEGLCHKHENGRTKIFAMSFNHKYRVKKETKSLDIQIKEPRSCLLASNLYMDKDGTFGKVQMSVTHTTMRRKTNLWSVRCVVHFWFCSGYQVSKRTACCI